jgi:16S rRNA A1518/A1519 N6-dimethyltransferase RsmA/KsgA/DIM1 with predicted DNA glycosylase/AP lyase activity
VGAGHGAITTALVASGARVIAVERDERLAGRLRRRFDGHPGISTVIPESALLKPTCARCRSPAVPGSATMSS